MIVLFVVVVLWFFVLVLLVLDLYLVADSFLTLEVFWRQASELWLWLWLLMPFFPVLSEESLVGSDPLSVSEVGTTLLRSTKASSVRSINFERFPQI